MICRLIRIFAALLVIGLIFWFASSYEPQEQKDYDKELQEIQDSITLRDKRITTLNDSLKKRTHQALRIIYKDRVIRQKSLRIKHDRYKTIEDLDSLLDTLYYAALRLSAKLKR